MIAYSFMDRVDYTRVEMSPRGLWSYWLTFGSF